MKILLIDDHQLFIDGMKSVLGRALPLSEMSQTNSSVNALEQLINGISYDLVLLDLLMPDMNGLSFLNALHDHSIVVPVAVVSASEDVNEIKSVLDAGAIGFIPKSSNSEELLNAVKLILEGELYVPDWYVKGKENFRNVESEAFILAQQIGISSRQLQVLELMSKGHSNKSIGQVLFLTESTIKSHVSNIFRIFKIENRTECINFAKRKGIISHES